MPKRRESPLNKAATLDSVLDKAHRKYAGGDNLVKITVRIPIWLKNRLKDEAYNLTRHRRRGLQDLVSIFLEYALESYTGEDEQVDALRLKTTEKTVEVRIARARD